jgi:FMNH2-dependent dimethyl sulfone monooxygenase
MTLRFGYWLPVFGGWLRNVEEEGMPATWEYVRDLAVRSERIGFDLALVAELNLNDIKGPEAPALAEEMERFAEEVIPLVTEERKRGVA